MKKNFRNIINDLNNRLQERDGRYLTPQKRNKEMDDDFEEFQKLIQAKVEKLRKQWEKDKEDEIQHRIGLINYKWQERLNSAITKLEERKDNEVKKLKDENKELQELQGLVT